MPWIRMQDNHPDDVDLELAGNEAAGWMHFRAICYSSRNLTDGFISHAALRKLTTNRSWKRHAEVLIDAGWFIEVEGGIQVAHYTDYQSTRAEVEARRDRESERKREARAKKRALASAECPPGTTAGQDAESGQCPALVHTHTPPPTKKSISPKATELDSLTALTPQPLERARARGLTESQREAFDNLRESLPAGQANPDRFAA